ncbi:MAG TPA: four-carbon acid sugar kinase family protein [Aggregatilinea sp.]|uniref:four-carbon acid sugar kinase family protein n=1 Tax=Aggregatilinea sp. TaxID=2806333 RepID=UPI002BB0E1C6|nr:four-carbon acid sugar kinase family protein [Aggregatilinea sp.]HML20899.1 four-carbon acid sugar kinase family protein [Aggregatilinea sp.]
MAGEQSLSLAFYGDDFTGSTDALEFLSRAGIRTVLFLDDPIPEKIERFGRLDAVGVAGMTRAMVPDDMADTLSRAFAVLGELKPRHVHYKVCSTFDSSPEIGNIGTAIETGVRIFQNEFTPVLVAAPHLGRYSAFGNLYARMGIGSQGAIYRLDRHPSMRAHPITPASESDLRLHLSQQIQVPMGLIDLVDIAKPSSEIAAKLDAEIAAGKKIIFFDVMYEDQMAAIGEVLDQKAGQKSPLFSVGSSGIEKALGDYWAHQGAFSPRREWEPVAECSPMLVLSGSVSPITAAQIEWAVAHGFDEIEVAAQILEGEALDGFVAEYQEAIVSSLRRGRSVIVHTSKGPDDARIAQTRSICADRGWDEHTLRAQTARIFGQVLGQAARGALEQVPVERLVIAGGDTSSFVARRLGIEAVEMIAPLFSGAPLCRAFAPGSPVDGIEVNLKGGQVGDDHYFGVLQKGK